MTNLPVDVMTIYEVIDENCHAVYRYYTEGVGHCILGGMAVRAGLPLPLHNARHVYAMPDWSRQLACAYGVSEALLSDLQDAHDSWADLDVRREVLRGVLTEYIEAIEAK